MAKVKPTKQDILAKSYAVHDYAGLVLTAVVSFLAFVCFYLGYFFASAVIGVIALLGWTIVAVVELKSWRESLRHTGGHHA